MAVIVIVDDDPTVRLIASELLRHDDHVVVEAADGAEALAVIGSMAVDLVVLDMLMPNKDGVETIGELRRHLLDALRADAFEHCERTLEQMDEIYTMLVTIDYPDALTANLRRATDVARGILERTRGDYTVAVQQQRLVQRLEAAER